MRFKWLLFSGLFAVGVLLLPFSYASYTYVSDAIGSPSASSQVAQAQAATAGSPWSGAAIWQSVMRQVDGVLTFTAQTIDAIGDAPAQLFDVTANDPPESPAEVAQLDPTTAAESQFPSLPGPQIYDGTLIMNVPLQVSNDLTVGGQTQVSDLFVNGEFSITDLTVPGVGTFGSLVGGGTQLGSLSVSGNTQLNTLSVSGPVNFANLTAGTLTVSNALTAAGNISATGGITTSGADVDLGSGEIFAANIVNEIIAGDDIEITGPPNAPTISADVRFPSFSRVRSLNDLDGSVTLSGGPGIAISGSGNDITITSTAGIGTYLALTDTPASFATGSIPYVNATGSALTQSSDLTFNGSQLAIGAAPVTELTIGGDVSVLGQRAVRFYGPSDTNYVGFRASTTLSGNTEWTLPAADGNPDEFLVTDGAGTLRFADLSAIGLVTELNDLSDVTLSGTTAGDMLVYDGGQWVDRATSTLGLGDGTFLGLTDTPANYLPDALIFSNPAGDALTQSSNLLFDGTQLALGSTTPVTTLTVDGDVSVLGQQALRFYDPSNTNYVGLQASSTLAGDTVWTLPAADGNPDEIMVTDGSGNLRFADLGALGVVTELNDLSDVTLSGTTAGDMLVYDGGQWVDRATSTLGLGDGTFLGLTDTPANYLPAGLVYANAAGDALVQSTDLLFNGSQLAIGSTTPVTELTVAGDVSVQGQQAVRFYGPSDTNYVGFRASSSLSGDTVWSLPAADGSPDEFIVTDGAGNLRFADFGSLGGVSELDDLSDVTLSATTEGDVLVYDGGQWVDQATSTLGLGDGTFLGLADTPGSYVANAVLVANAAADAVTQSANFTFNGSEFLVGTTNAVTTLTVGGDLSLLDQQAARFYETDNSNYVGFRASSSLSGDTTWTLPAADGTSDQVIVTDGAGNLRFESVSAVGGGVSTYLDLIDTPSSYTANAIPYTASSSDQLLFSSDLVFDGDNGFMGIGTNAPSDELTVHGSVYFGFDDATPGIVYDDTAGRVGIGTATTTAKLDVVGGSVRQRGGTALDQYTPSQIGSANLPNNGNDLFVIGTNVYVVTSAGSSQFVILDVSDKADPAQVGTEDLSDVANDLYVSGGYAYVVTNVSGSDFHVIDVSDRTTPNEVGSVNLPTSALGVTVQGRYAYVTTANTGDDFHIVDISDPRDPVELGSLDLADSGSAVAVQGDYAYVANDTAVGGFNVIDVSDPNAPVVVGTEDLPSNGTDVVVRGEYAYVSTASVGDDFNIIDVSDPTSPSILSSLGLVTGANSVAVSGDYAYVATAGTGDDLHVIDISDLSDPVEIGSEELFSGTAFSVAVRGRYGYITTSSVGDDLHIFDLTGVEAQTVLAHSLESGSLSVLGDIVAAGEVSLARGLRAGTQGIQTDGSLLIQGTSTSLISGNVGIGTTSAPHALTVGGDAIVEGDLYDSDFNAGSYGQLLMANDIGQVWTATSSLGLSEAFTTSADLADLLSDETGTAGSAVFSVSPTFTGTVEVSALTASSALSLSGTAANIALGSNYLSGDGDDEGVFVTGDGLVGIGTSTPPDQLTVVGDIRVGEGTTGCVKDADGTTISGTCSSDERLKTDVVSLASSTKGYLEALVALEPVTYRWNELAASAFQYGTSKQQTGLIAQQVEDVMPELVATSDDGFLQIRFSELPIYTIQALKELWAVVTGNQEKIDTLENRVQQLEAQLGVEHEESESEGSEAETAAEETETDTDTESEDSEVRDENGSENPTAGTETDPDVSATTSTSSAAASTETSSETSDGNTEASTSTAEEETDSRTATETESEEAETATDVIDEEDDATAASGPESDAAEDSAAEAGNSDELSEEEANTADETEPDTPGDARDNLENGGDPSQETGLDATAGAERDDG